jgi:adenosylhomocysteine nucleosidase
MDQPVLILGALREEIAGIRGRMLVEDQFKAGHGDVWSGTWENRSIVLVRTGVGKKCANKVLEDVLHRVEPSLILSTGYAGGLSHDLNVGDLVVADRVLDDSAESFSGEELSAAAPDRQWLDQVKGLNPSGRFSIHYGTLLTVSGVVADSSAKLQLGSRCGALAVDMETSVLLTGAGEKNIPFLSIRAVSDTADQSLADVSSLVGKDGTVSKLKAGWYVATHPQTIPHFISLRQQSQKATRNLTDFIRTLLQVPDCNR